MCVHAPLYGGHLDAIVVSPTVSLEFLQVPRVSEHLHECVRRFFGVRGVISRATLSIYSPLVLILHFHFALCAVTFIV